MRVLTLEQAMTAAEKATPLTRIDFRDPIAHFGEEGITAVQPWLRRPELAAFAVRVITRAGELGSKRTAVAVLAVELKTAASESMVNDLQSGLHRLGATRLGSGGTASPKARARATFSTPEHDLVRGRSYKRRDLHAAGWGGNPQSGISYPAGGEHALLFSDPAMSHEHGYRDRWVGDEYHYYGAWNGTGDMVLSGSNKTILDRSPHLHLLIRDQDLWRYEGQFECLGHEPELTVRDGREFRAIVFILKRAA